MSKYCKIKANGYLWIYYVIDTVLEYKCTLNIYLYQFIFNLIKWNENSNYYEFGLFSDRENILGGGFLDYDKNRTKTKPDIDFRILVCEVIRFQQLFQNAL